MKLPAWKTLGWAMLSLPLLGNVGCSGINASKSISPLDFFLPGLLQADPPPAPSPLIQPEPVPVQHIAQVR